MSASIACSKVNGWSDTGLAFGMLALPVPLIDFIFSFGIIFSSPTSFTPPSLRAH